MILGPLFMLLVVIGIIAAIILVLRSLGIIGTSQADSKPAANGYNAFDILRDRFAKGEIDTKEFEERKRLLAE